VIAPSDVSIQHSLREARDRAREVGITVPPVEGKLLRPRIAVGFVPPTDRPALPDSFWSGALAIQAVHEASLLHDDILDEAQTRRGAPTVAHERGIGAALVQGDLLLTGSYRLAKQAGDRVFVSEFIDAVEQTVQGEALQNRSAGTRLTAEEYRAIVDRKSGALFGAAAVLAGTVSGRDLDRHRSVGVRLGRAYQMLDDLLDYCPAFDTGKPPLQDFAQGKWTWPLAFCDGADFGASSERILRQLFTRCGEGRTCMRLALDHFQGELDGLMAEVQELSAGDRILRDLADEWLDVASLAVETQERALVPAPAVAPTPGPRTTGVLAEAAVRRRAARLADPAADWDVFRRHARTFSFASRLFPTDTRRKVAALYAFCRFTDDLIDDPNHGVDPALRSAALDVWSNATRRAYQGLYTGIPFLDRAMGMLAESRVPFRYVNDLLEGVRMDLAPARYSSMSELLSYTYRVAGSLGRLMTELWDVRDPDVLARAEALGDAMQLTNILRDVGEDLDRGRIYLPEELLQAYGIGVADLIEYRTGARALPESWADLTEHLMADADARYARAFQAITALPHPVRPAVAVAARAYQGIHDEIRRNGYDNLSRRARTGSWTKMRLAYTALRDLRSLEPFPQQSSGVAGPQTSDVARWPDRMAAGT